MRPRAPWSLTPSRAARADLGPNGPPAAPLRSAAPHILRRAQAPPPRRPSAANAPRCVAMCRDIAPRPNSGLPQAVGDSLHAHPLRPGVAHTWHILTLAPAVQGHVRHNERVSPRRSRRAARCAGATARRKRARPLNPVPHGVAAAAGERNQLEKRDGPRHAMMLRSQKPVPRRVSCLAARMWCGQAQTLLVLPCRRTCSRSEKLGNGNEAGGLSSACGASDWRWRTAAAAGHPQPWRVRWCCPHSRRALLSGGRYTARRNAAAPGVCCSGMGGVVRAQAVLGCSAAAP